MINFRSITYKNLLSVGNSPISIRLDSHNLTLATGKNGSGKSIMTEALTFALFGKPLRPFNKPALVNSINQKQLLVELEFDIGKKNYLIKRGIKPNIFEIYENDKLINQDPSVKDYQKVLEQQIIKMNYRAFTQIVIMGSSSYTPFMRLKPHERREFIEDLLDIRIFSVMNGLLKDKTKLLKDQLKDVEVEIKSLREKIALQEKHINSRKKEKVDSIKVVSDEIEVLIDDNDRLQTEIALDRLKVEQLTESAKEFEDSTEKLTELKVLHKRIEANIKKHNEEREFYHNVEDCPLCRQNVGDDHRKHIVGTVDQKLQELEKDLVDLQKQLETVNKQMSKYESFSNEINEINQRVTRNNRMIAVNNALIEDKKMLISQTENDTSSIDEETKTLREYARNIVTKSELKRELLESQEYQMQASILLQDNGIKAKIIKQYIPVINKMVNKYLDSLDFFVGFHLDENFNEVIKSRYRDTFTYESFSDGQKRRIDMALLLTWRDVAKAKNSINTNLLFLDEADGPLDGVGADMLMELYKISDIKNVFIISHKEGLANTADRVVSFELKNNFTILKDD